jgi:hypothetical protein
MKKHREMKLNAYSSTPARAAIARQELVPLERQIADLKAEIEHVKSTKTDSAIAADARLQGLYLLRLLIKAVEYDGALIVEPGYQEKA